MGENVELHTFGSDARKTEERQAALEITEDPEVEGFNARQIMLKHKAAHGSGSNLDFPDADKIRGNMKAIPKIIRWTSTVMEAIPHPRFGGQP